MACRVVVADEHALYLEGIAGIVDRWDGFEVAGTAIDGASALTRCCEEHPDIALLDVRLPVMNGVEVTEGVRRSCPGTKVVLMAMRLSEDDLISAIVNGASGYLLKDIRAKALESLLRSVATGGYAIAPEAVGLLVSFVRRHAFSGGLADSSFDKMKSCLTEHEHELLRCVALGKSNREISAQLYLSESTVKKQVSAMLAKLGMENRTQAAVFALRAGLID